MNNELKTGGKEEVVAYVNALFWHLPGGTEENMRITGRNALFGLVGVISRLVYCAAKYYDQVLIFLFHRFSTKCLLL